MNCFICGNEAVENFVNPPLCQRHHDFALIKAITRRTGFTITAENLADTYKRVRFEPSFPESDIPALLEETTPKQAQFEFGSML